MINGGNIKIQSRITTYAHVRHSGARVIDERNALWPRRRFTP